MNRGEHKEFEFQHEGSDFLAGKNLALLADEMGLGKTFQTIEALDKIQAKTVIVLCPAVAKVNWRREINDHSIFPRLIFIFEKRDSVLPRNAEVIICNYELLENLVLQLKGKYDCLILDEAHFLKNMDAKRTQFALGKQGVIRFAKRIWALSGTPAPNHAGELWPLFFTFGITSLSHDDFILKYCKVRRMAYGLKIMGTKIEAVPEIQELLKKFMLRRTSDDVLKLPNVDFSNHYIRGTELDYKTFDSTGSLVRFVVPNDIRNEFYERIAREKLIVETSLMAVPEIKRAETLTLIANSVSKLREYTGLQKIIETADLVLSELEANAYQKIVIFAIHREVIEGLRQKLQKFDPVTLYGGTPPRRRQKNIDRFQTNPRCRVFIGNITAAGVAITLTAANQILFVEQDWVPGNNVQALYRVRRIGQKRRVFCRYMVIEDSIDEKIMAVLRQKTKELKAIFDEEELTDPKNLSEEGKTK